MTYMKYLYTSLVIAGFIGLFSVPVKAMPLGSYPHPLMSMEHSCTVWREGMPTSNPPGVAYCGGDGGGQRMYDLEVEVTRLESQVATLSARLDAVAANAGSQQLMSVQQPSNLEFRVQQVELRVYAVERLAQSAHDAIGKINSVLAKVRAAFKAHRWAAI